MLINYIRKIYHKYYINPRTWFIRFGLPNINDPKKLVRDVKWKLLPRYKKFPHFIIIDPIVKCNLDCPLCGIPPKILNDYGSKLSLEDFNKILNKVEGTTNHIVFCHAGEPFLNNEIYKMIKAVNDLHMVSSTVTNGTLLNKNNINEIIKSGLDFLQISFDGFSKVTYEKYRVGADFDKVFAGVKELIKTKKKGRWRKPHIEITYLIHAYNQHEFDKTRDYFKKLRIPVKPLSVNLNIHRRNDNKTLKDLEHWVPFGNEYFLYKKGDKGTIIRKTPGRIKCDTCMKPVIRCDGTILLCCHDIFESIKLGNIYDCNFKEFWMSERYRKIREKASVREFEVCKVCGK